MRRILIAWLMLCAALFAAWQVQTPAAAQCDWMLGVANCKTPASGGGTTTFDPSNLGTGNALSGGNLVVSTSDTSTNAYAVARSITSHSTGKFYFEVTLTSNGCGAGCIVVGIANGSATLQGGAYPGRDANLWAACYGNEGWTLNTVNNSNCITFAAVGDVIGVAVDYTNSLIWIRDVTVSSTTWNAGGGAAPGGTGGQSISVISCPCYAAYGGFTDFSTESATANFGGTAYAATAPAGFGNY